MRAGIELTTEREQDIWYIRIKGEFTRNSTEQFLQSFPWLHCQEGIKYIVLDMHQMDYFNSSGISLLIRFVREVQQRNYQVFAHGVSNHYQKIFHLVGLTAYIELFPDEYSVTQTLQARREFEIGQKTD